MAENRLSGDMADRFGCHGRSAETLIFAVFQELSGRLEPAEAAELAAQLPPSLRMLWSSFDYPGRSVSRVKKSHFLEEVCRMVGFEDEGKAEEAILSLFSAHANNFKTPTGQRQAARHVISQLLESQSIVTDGGSIEAIGQEAVE